MRTLPHQERHRTCSTIRCHSPGRPENISGSGS
ncbi:CxxxxCH/CxxCH domain-containing protein [Deinococcus malanensis]